jgi:chromate reductase
MAPNVVSICGSLRKGSYNRMVMNSLPALAPAGMSIKEAPPFAEFPPYNGDVESAGFPKPVIAFADAIRAADGVIIVSPENNWSIPGVLKNAIDWASRVKDQPFEDKPVALQSAARGLLGGSRMQYHLRQCLTSIEALLLIRPEVFVTFAPTKIDEKTGELTDQATRDMIKQQLAAFATFIGQYGAKK